MDPAVVVGEDVQAVGFGCIDAGCNLYDDLRFWAVEELVEAQALVKETEAALGSAGQVLLRYFGETLADPCGNCGTCREGADSWDGTMAAQKALSGVYRTGQRFGAQYLIF